MIDATPRREQVLFIHGFGSSPSCWTPLLEMLRGDDAITCRYHLDTWKYGTKWAELNPTRRIATLNELGERLASDLGAPPFRDRQLTLVGHSQGGLVIQKMIQRLLERGEGRSLSRLRQVILMATPNRGSITLSRFRKFASRFLDNPQERNLRVLCPDVADMMAVLRDRVENAAPKAEITGIARRIPVTAFWGLQDNVVPQASARGPYESLVPVPGNHFTVIKPPDRSDPRYKHLVELLLDPPGHKHRFEIAHYHTAIMVQPVKPQVIRTRNRVPRDVTYDNFATLNRTCRFTVGNRCGRRFTIRYGTRSNGYLEGSVTHPNQADQSQLGEWETTGTVYYFSFAPESHGGHCTADEYGLNLNIYKGFDAKERNVHFHLGDHSRYQRMTYEIDLSAYLAAGARFRASPALYHLPETRVTCSEACTRPGNRAPVKPREDASNGVVRWELEDVSGGVVAILWELEHQDAAGAA